MNKKKYYILVIGFLFNLTIGVLYVWSLIKSELTSDLGWTKNEATLPYTVAIFVFALGVLIGGRIQDRVGPKKVITLGGLFVGLGMILSSFLVHNPSILIVTFGVISGLGIGFGYGCVSPCCLKWFHSSQKGLISGVVVGAFGLGSVVYSPITSYLLKEYAVSETFLFIGIGICVITFVLSRFIENPDENYVASIPRNYIAAKSIDVIDYSWKEMLRTRHFYLLIVIYASGASVGLMIIGNISDIFNNQVGTNSFVTATMMVSLLAIFNAFGRLLAGVISDKIGRMNTLIITAILQGTVMLCFGLISTVPTIILGCFIVGYSFGSYLSVIPAYTADNFGLKNYGINYGIIYLSWGVAGIIAPMIAANIGLEKAYYVCAVLSLIALVFTILLNRLGRVRFNH